MKHLRRLAPHLWQHRFALARGLAYLAVTAVLAAASPWVLRAAVDDLTLRLTRAKLWYYAAAIVALVLGEGVFRYATRMTLIGLSRDVEYELRQDLYVRLSRLAPAYYHAHRIGDLMSRATNDVAAVRMVLGPGIMYSANTLATFVTALALMAAISPRLLGVSLLPLLVVAWLVQRYGRLIHDRSQKVQEQLAHLSALVQENLSGARVLRAYVQEPSERRRFQAANEEYLGRSRRLILLVGGVQPLVITLLGLGMVLVLWLGGRMVATHAISLGDFVAFMVYLGMLHWPTIAIGWVVNIVERGEASMGRCLEVLDATTEIPSVQGPARVDLRGAVEFRHLSFAYADGRRVLHDVDLVVPAGTTVAIVGPTGAGKSTLVGLLPRLHDPEPGMLFVDGRDVRELSLAALRRAIGCVPQEAFLFSQTLRANVALGDPERAPGEARIEWAVEAAQLAGDVREFPLSYETEIGERGITLSGGQKQRTALARALVRDPRILILDDALASVDARTEEQILAALKRLARGRTTFIVSHRVSSVRWADLIVVLKDGRIVERGNHDDLIAAAGYYADLYRRQLLEEEVAAV